MKFLFAFFIILSFCVASVASNLYFYSLNAQEDGEMLKVSGLPQALAPYSLLRKESNGLPSALYTYTLDAPFYELARLLELLGERHLFEEKSTRFDLVTFRFQILIRDLAGRRLSRQEYDVKVQLTGRQGVVVLTGLNTESEIGVTSLREEKKYLDFLQKLVFPRSSFGFPLPSSSEYIVDFSYLVIETRAPPIKDIVFEGEPSLMVLKNLKFNKILMHLGSTYCERGAGEVLQYNSSFLHFFRDNLFKFDTLMNAREKYLGKDLIKELETYLESFPLDKKVLSMLVNTYIQDKQYIKASRFIERHVPIFSNLEGGLENRVFLKKKVQKIKEEILKQKSSFREDQGVQLNILLPRAGDLISGRTFLEFDLQNTSSPILHIDCFLDNELFTAPERPPFLVSFEAPGHRREVTVKVVVYFENQTFREASVSCRPFKVDEEQEVNLISLRAVVTKQEKEFLTNLNRSDFRVYEYGREKEVIQFSKDSLPLNIALVIDASLSMNGEKIHKAQYAVQAFLKKLSAKDQARIYTFNGGVVRHAQDPIRNFDALKPLLLTLSPMLTTSLNDALFIAHQDLLPSHGNKVIIVLSDGADSTSIVSERDIETILGSSPVTVYPIAIHENPKYEEYEGTEVLQRIARMTGSVALVAKKVSKLDVAFDRIYEELSSFYYINFYSKYRDTSLKDIQIKVRKHGATVRFRKQEGLTTWTGAR